jgi:hypothetical protein
MSNRGLVNTIIMEKKLQFCTRITVKNGIFKHSIVSYQGTIPEILAAATAHVHLLVLVNRRDVVEQRRLNTDDLTFK